MDCVENDFVFLSLESIRVQSLKQIRTQNQFKKMAEESNHNILDITNLIINFEEANTQSVNLEYKANIHTILSELHKSLNRVYLALLANDGNPMRALYGEAYQVLFDLNLKEPENLDLLRPLTKDAILESNRIYSNVMRRLFNLSQN